MAATMKTTGNQVFGWVVVTGASVFVLTAVVAHVLERDHDIVRSSLSSYAVSTFGYIMEIGFFALAIAYAALTLALARRPLPPATGQWVRVGVVGLAIEALAVLFVALFPANGLGKVGGLSVHGTAATIAFVVFPPTAILLALAFRSDHLLRSVASAALTIALVNTLAVIVFGIAVAGNLPWIYLAEKADSLVSAVWLVVVGRSVH